MKKVSFALITLCFSILLQGQISKTADVTAGGLKASLTDTELATITNLTLTGTLDARDFKTMRDNMSVLTVLDLSETSILSYTGTEGTSSLTDYPANTLPMYSFYINNTYLTSVLIPSTVTSIGSFAFYYCTGLKNLTIPSSVTSIDFMAFYNCTALKILNIPSSVTSISSMAFSNCSALESLNIPSSVLTIETSAFSNCTALTSISIPSSVTDIGNGAFFNCGGLINVDTGNQKYSSLDGVLFDKQQTSLIQYPSSKTGNYNVPSSVRSIGNGAFYYCVGLTSISLPQSLNTIEYNAFGSCSGLTSINIPSSVTTVEGNILVNCTGLNSIYIANEKPLDLTNISGVFEGLNKSTCKLYVPFGSSMLYSVASQWKDFANIIEMAEFKLSANSATIASDGGSATFILTTGQTWSAGSDSNWLEVSPSTGNGTNTLTLTASANSSVGCRFATITVSSPGLPSQFISIKQEGTVKTINVTAGGLAAALTANDLTNIYSLIVTGTIDARDFRTMSYEMPGLQIIDLSGTTVKAYSGTEGTDLGFWDYPSNAVPDYAFSKGLTGNESLRSIKLPSKVTSVGYGAFYNCSALSSIQMPSTITTFRMVAFSNCTSLSAIDLPSSLKYIDEGAFYGCSALTSITIPESVTTIKRIAFSGCTKLASINLPSSVTYVDDYTFHGIINVDEGNPVYSSIDGVMFDKLKTTLIHYPSTRTGDYTIPSSVITIGDNAFINCAGITSITIPSAVTSIGNSAFYGCSSLKTLTLPESVKLIWSSAFAGCLSLASVIIPASVTTIWSGAFYNCTNLIAIYNQSPVPQDINVNPDVFGEVDKSVCKLYIPFGTSTLYASATKWQDFTNIVEMAEFKLSTKSINISATGGAVQVDLTTSLTWSATTDKSWLTLNPDTGTGSQTLTLSIDGNPYIFSRTATVTVTVPGIPSKTILITQEMSPEKVTISAGGLSDSLTAEELKIAKKLVLTGTIDARDFKTMRDDMPLLTELDLSGVSIAEYSGTLGTYGTNDVRYPADFLPVCAFLNPYTSRGKTTLTAVVLPSSVLVIQNYAFYGCTGLTSLNIPQSVMAIGHYAFFGCMSLTSADIPASVELIGNYAFVSCNGMINVASGNQYYSSIGGVLYNKQQTTLIQCPTSKTGVFYIPFKVTSIGEYAFYNSALSVISYTSSSLTSIGDYACAYSYGLSAFSIPPSVNSIGKYAFYNCTKLQRISCGNETPVNLNSSENVFEGVNKSLCKLYIPGGSYELYITADQWKDFLNIVEQKGLTLSATSISFTADGGSVVANIRTGAEWTAVSDKTWLTLNPESGYRNSSLSITAGPNTSIGQRTAIVTVSAPEVVSKTITITQSGSAKAINVTPGNLATVLTASELSSATRLTLTGSIDARDFKTMRDDMPLLAELDLSSVTIAAYSGTLGTEGTGNITYEANSTPQLAFYSNVTHLGKTSLIAVSLPSSTTSIKRYSFSQCSGLTFFNIPGSVTSIEYFSFNLCTGLRSITIPPSVKTIEFYAFLGCTGLTPISIPATLTNIQYEAFSECGSINVDAGNPNYSSIDGILFNKAKTQLIHVPVSQSGFYPIPSSVSSVAKGAFRSCSNLTAVNIPNSVTSIESFAFFYCTGLQSMYVKSIAPVNLNSSTSVFNYVDKTLCILHVPQGTKANYASTNQWKDFVNIVEMPAFNLSASNINIAASEGSTASVNVTTGISWSANSDKSWLSVNPGSGTGNNTLIFTADANTLSSPRTAIVTVFGTEVGSQTITVTQDGILTGINKAEDFNIKIYPNPATEYLIVETVNYSETQNFLIEIFDQLGRKVFETIINQPKYEIRLSSWSGKGVYYLKFYDRNKILIVVKKIIIQ
jgi:hypothetical protein